MLDFLFRRLTAEPRRGGALFEAVTRLAREPHWYVEGEVPDTFDGRFAVLATVASFVLVRLEREGERGNGVSVALTERFIEVMESEHRELGLGDPTLGKTVRKLVGSLGRRTGLWRLVVETKKDWAQATAESLYKAKVSPDALAHSANALERLAGKLDASPIDEIAQGKI